MNTGVPALLVGLGVIVKLALGRVIAVLVRMVALVRSVSSVVN